MNEFRPLSKLVLNCDGVDAALYTTTVEDVLFGLNLDFDDIGTDGSTVIVTNVRPGPDSAEVEDDEPE